MYSYKYLELYWCKNLNVSSKKLKNLAVTPIGLLGYCLCWVCQCAEISIQSTLHSPGTQIRNRGSDPPWFYSENMYHHSRAQLNQNFKLSEWRSAYLATVVLCRECCNFFIFENTVTYFLKLITEIKKKRMKINKVF